MTVKIGLNTNRLFSDVSDTGKCLESLGLNLDDIKILNGENSELGNALIDIPINKEELTTLSGLDIDSQKELYSISRAASRISELSSDIEDIGYNMNNNISINSRIQANSIKYRYYDYNTNTTKINDISTSMTSVFSGNNTSISYGGELKILDSGNTSTINATSLSLGKNPIPIKFLSENDNPEMPTHLLSLNINGVTKQVYVMKNIPLTWKCFFRNALNGNPNITKATDQSFSSGDGGSGLYYKVNDFQNTKARWIIRNTDDLQEYISNAGDQTLDFTDSISKERDVELYYNPDEMLHIGLSGLNISEIPETVLPKLEYYNLSENDLFDMPNFSYYTPNLKTLLINGNNLSRGRFPNGDIKTANTQLNSNLPSSLLTLNISGCFSDSENIHLESACPNLLELTMNSYYNQFSQRSMTSLGPSPSVSNTVIKYIVRNQSFKYLSSSVCDLENLKDIDMTNNNILGRENPDSSNTTPIPITLNSQNLMNLSMTGNKNNLISVAGVPTIITYTHQNGKGLLGGDSQNNINSIFDASNTLLRDINLFQTDVTGNINQAFQNLPSLINMDARFSRLSGNLEDNSFSGTPKLEVFRISNGLFDSNDFFSATSQNGSVFSSTPLLRELFIYSNRGIKGVLPNFSNNTNIRTLFISGTGITGNVPLFSNNPLLNVLSLADNELSGSIPSFENNIIRLINLSKNLLDGDFSTTNLVCPRLLVLNFSYNSLIGNIPNFNNCNNLVTLNLQNNNLSGYTSGSFSQLTSIATIDLSQNSLNATNAESIINDLIINYNTKQRSNVSVNMSGNNFDLNALNATTYNNIQSLSSLGWTITI